MAPGRVRPSKSGRSGLGPFGLGRSGLGGSVDPDLPGSSPYPPRRGRRRRAGLALLTALALGAAVTVGNVVVSGPGPSPSGRLVNGPAHRAPASAPPSPSDVAAGAACAAFETYLSDARAGAVPAAVGARLVADAGGLLSGAQADQAAGRPLPPWSVLGSDLLAAASDVLHHNGVALGRDGPAAAALCRQVPAAAAAAGGYSRA